MAEITFLVFTFNEERRLDYILRCVQPYGDIVVIDNFSTDKTVEIARQYTNKVYQFKNPGFIENEETMSFALSKAHTKWVYLTYVDELLPKPLLEELVKISKQDQCDIVEIYRKNFMYGQEIYNYGKHHLRMFLPNSVDFKSNIIHKLGRCLVSKDRVCKIRATDDTSIWHFSSYNSSKLELAHNRYANLEAVQLHDIGKRFSGLRAIFKLMFFFWGTYIGLGGIRGGWPGLFISVQIAYFKFSIEARLWEYENNRSLVEIEKKYDELKESLLAGTRNTTIVDHQDGRC